MNYLKQRKELIPLTVAAILFTFAAFNLFQTQQVNSRLLTKGATVLPTFATGRAACELPVPDLYQRERNRSDETVLFKAPKLSDSLKIDLPAEKAQSN